MVRGGSRPGSGRPPGSISASPRRVRWPVRWTDEEQLLIERAAERTGQSVSDIIRDATMERVFKLLA